MSFISNVYERQAGILYMLPFLIGPFCSTKRDTDIAFHKFIKVDKMKIL